MRTIYLSAIALLLVATVVFAASAANPLPCDAPSTGHLSVSAVGRIISGSPPFLLRSPNGNMQLRIRPVTFSGEIPLNTIEITAGATPIATRTQHSRKRIPDRGLRSIRRHRTSRLRCSARPDYGIRTRRPVGAVYVSRHTQSRIRG